MKKVYSLVREYKFLLLLIVLPLVFFSPLIFNPQSIFFPSQDIISIFFQEKELFQDTVVNHNDLPLWNPYIFSGTPFLGNPTSSMFYPINILFLLLPVGRVFGYVFIIDSILVGVFTYLFARCISLNKFSSFISGTTIMFSGPLLTLIFPGHLVNFDTFIWLPLILLIFEKAVKKQKIIYAILAGFPIALTILAGAPQIAAFSLFAASIYYFLRTAAFVPQINKFSYFRKAIIIFIVSIAVGFLLSAIQILPSSEFSQLSARSKGLGYEFASDFSLHPKQLISFVLPYFFGDPASGTYWGKGNFWSLNGYMGILPILLALIAITIKLKRLMAIFLVLGLFALLFSFGKYSFIFPFFYNYIPLLDSFRAPSRFLYIYAFSIAILAGFGAETLIQKLSLSKKTILSKTSLTFSLAGTLTLFIFLLVFIKDDIKLYEKYILNNSYAVGINHSILYSQLTQDLLIFSVILLIFNAILFLKIKNKISINFLKLSLVLIILFDLWIYNLKIISVKNITDIYRTADFISKIKKNINIFRIFDKEGFYLPITAKNKIENITGIHSLYIRDYRDFVWSIGKHENKAYESFFEIKNIQYPIFLDLLNVKYVILNHKIYENPNILPRAYIVPNAIVVSKDKILNKLKEDNFDPKKQIILQKKPNVSLANSSSYKEVGILHKEPNEIKLKTNLEEPGYLVLSEIDYPGWKAFDNGKELEIYNADYILRSVYLSKGAHDISFVYVPTSYRIGKTISLITFFSCLIILFYKKIHRLVDIKRLFL